MTNTKQSKTTFGFKNVDKDEKIGLVKNVFESVAIKYDIMNDLMSAGIHRLWKNKFINMIDPNNDMTMLDVAGGTGDIAFRFLENGGGRVVVCDLTEGMVRVGKNRALDKGLFSNIDWLVGNAQKLPLQDNSVDVYSISFGLRNVADIDEALTEAYRVLKPSGRFMCLEFSSVVIPVLDKIYDGYSFKVLPKIGKIVADDEESYQYLVESIRRFPKQDELIKKMKKAGFENTTYTYLTGGISAIHSGYKI